jgi:hypothetical protein
LSYRVELSEWARKDFNRRREFSRSMLAGSARLWENRDMEKYAVVIHEDPQGGSGWKCPLFLAAIHKAKLWRR